MDPPALVSLDFEGGRQAVEAVEAAGMRVDFAFWAYFDEAREWRLIFATPLVDRRGFRAVYKVIHKALIDNAVPLSLTRVGPVGLRDVLGRFAVTELKAGGRFRASRSYTVVDPLRYIVVDARYVYRPADAQVQRPAPRVARRRR